MNANLKVAMSRLSPAMIEVVVKTLSAKGEAEALDLANTLASFGGSPTPATYSKPDSYSHGDAVLVPWTDKNISEVGLAVIVGQDFIPGTRTPRQGWYVVLLTEDGKEYVDALSSFPVEMIFPDNDGGRIQCQQALKVEADKAANKEAEKAHRRQELMSGFPYTEQSLESLSSTDKVLLLSILGVSPFSFQGDRGAKILEVQKAWLKNNAGTVSAAKKAVPAKVPNPSAAKVAIPAKSSTPVKVAAPQKAVASSPRVGGANPRAAVSKSIQPTVRRTVKK